MIMWQHTLIFLLAFSTTVPVDVVHAAMTREKVLNIIDGILEKIQSYGPLIVSFIAPFVAKKLVEIGAIKIISMVGSQIGKREAVVEGTSEVEAAEKYLLQKFNEMIETIKEEFHKRVDMEAINDEIENWQETIADVAKAVKDKVFEFIHQFGEFKFDGYVRRVIDSIISKRSLEKRSVTRLDEWDRTTLEKYDKMLEELRDVLKNRFVGH